MHLQCNQRLDSLIQALQSKYKQLFEEYKLWPKIASEVPTESLAVTHSLEVLLYRASKMFDEWKKANKEIFDLWKETKASSTGGSFGLLTDSMHFRYLQYELWDFVVRAKTALDFTSKILHPLFKGDIPDSISEALTKNINTDCPFYIELRNKFANFDDYNVITFTIDFRVFLIHKGVFIFVPLIDVCDQEHFELNKHFDHTNSTAIPPRLVILGDKLEETGLPIHLPEGIFEKPLHHNTKVREFRYKRPLEKYVSETLSTVLDLYDKALKLATNSQPKSFYWRRKKR